MEINYDRLILGSNLPMTKNVEIHIPTIQELTDSNDDKFSLFTRIFVTSVREQFSGVPEEVDHVEEKFPTFWDMAFDKEMNETVGQSMFGEGVDILSVLIHGFAYWTKTDVEQYRPLSNKKVISEELDWIIDKEEFIRFSNAIRMITLSEQNEELIAPEGISDKPHQCQVWKKLYAGRIRKLQRKPTKTLGDKILLLQALAPAFLPFSEVGAMTYYQFSNLLDTYEKRYAVANEYQIFVSQKFDTEKMKLTDLSEVVGQIRIKK